MEEWLQNTKNVNIWNIKNSYSNNIFIFFGPEVIT